MSCPVCGKATVVQYHPFCSRRCADVDLGRWLTEGYRIAVDPDEAETAPEADTPTPKAH